MPEDGRGGAFEPQACDGALQADVLGKDAGAIVGRDGGFFLALETAVLDFHARTLSGEERRLSPLKPAAFGRGPAGV